MANLITGIRIICSAVLVCVPVFSPAFYVLYVVAGISDMIDGVVARKTYSANAFGAKFDTIADLLLVGVCLFKFLPVLNMEMWMYVLVVVIAIIKIINIIWGFVIYKRFIVAHSLMNRITGLMVFVLPLTLTFIDMRYSALVVGVVALFAAVQETFTFFQNR